MRPLQSSLVRRVGMAGAIALAVQATSGCYTTMPVAAAAPESGVVVLEITDRGRVDLDGALGASPARVTGTVAEATDSTYTLAVRAVESVRGETAQWQGERVVIRRSGVASVAVRRFSRARTALAVAGVVGAVAAFVITRSLVAGGSGPGDVPTPGGPGPGQGS